MENMKFVDFKKYCPQCAHKLVQDTDEPCNTCLGEPARQFSQVPLKYDGPKPSKVKYGMPLDFVSPFKDEHPYLYSANYGRLDNEYARKYFKTKADFIPGACSSFSFHGLYCRSYDWNYDHQAEIFVHISKSDDSKYNVEGVSGGISKFTKEYLDSVNSKTDDLYRLVPFMMLDGRNDHNLCCNMNVVPTDYGKNLVQPKKEKRESLCGLELVSYILRNFEDPKTAAEYIRDYVEVYFPKALHDMDYELHYMVGNREKTYCIELVHDETKIIDISRYPIMTNFHLWNVVRNSDGTVYTPATQTEYRNAKDTNRITERGSGLERYNLIVKAAMKPFQNWSSDMNSTLFYKYAKDIMMELSYTKAYPSAEAETVPFWYTEFVGINGLTVKSKPGNFTATVREADRRYLERSRDIPNTWQSCHQIIYQIEGASTTSIRTQEEPGFGFR